MDSPLFLGLFVALSMMITFVAIAQATGRRKSAVEVRLEEYGVRGAGLEELEPGFEEEERRQWRGMNRLLARSRWGPRLAMALVRADVPLTAAEYTLFMLSASMVGFSLGYLLVNTLAGLLLAVVFAILPLYYLRVRRIRRQKAMTAQIPEILTLLVGGLRAGYGLSQSMGIVVDRLPAPAATEFARVVRAVGFGLPVQQALTDMAERVGVDDLELVVTAINVQYELGGNLAQTLDTIGETVRERLRIFREIRTMTAHQRMTAYVLAGEPIAIAVLLFMMSPDYIGKLFAPDPPWIRMLPIMAVIMVFIGFLIIRKIVDIEV